MLVFLTSFLLWFNLTIGVQNYSEIYKTDIYYHAPVTLDIEIHAESGNLDIFGIYSNEMSRSETIYFVPYQDYYTIGISYTLDFLTFSLLHMCQHPVATFDEQINGEFGAYNRFTITLGNKP